MDVSKYNFDCQKAFHLGLRYAKSLGHALLEIEHVALAMMKNNLVPGGVDGVAVRAVEQYLANLPRVFGTFKIEFGPRLDFILDRAEQAAAGKVVDEKLLWQHVAGSSSVIKNSLEKSKTETKKSAEFEAMDENGTYSPKSVLKKRNGKDEPAKGIKEEKKVEKADNPLADLQKYTVDLTELAERKELDPVIGRETEIKRVIEILGRKRKNNPILLGEPGVGKSAVAEGLAQRIAQGKVPESMKSKRVLSLDLGLVLAGAKFRGEFEERLKKILTILKDLEGKIILFIDEIHVIVGAGNPEGAMDAANLLKPALARGEIHCLAATTWKEYTKYIEKDAALARRFQPLMVPEPSEETAMSILRGLRTRYELHHGVKVSDGALRAAVTLSKRYLLDRNLPDKAIDLMDEAMSRKKFQIDSLPHTLDDLKNRLEALEIEKESVEKIDQNRKTIVMLTQQIDQVRDEYKRIADVWRTYQNLNEELNQNKKTLEELKTLFDDARVREDFPFAAKLQSLEMPKLRELQDVTVKKIQKMQEENSFLAQNVEEKDIAEVISQWTGIPLGKILENRKGKTDAMHRDLGQRVYGQDEAVKVVVKAVKRKQAGINDPKKPLGVFLFLGPTGVGKTELAKALTEKLFDDEGKMVRIDMSEYMENHSVSRLIGAPPGYVGFEGGGELTDAVRRNPFSLILLDEIEKAHPKVLDIFLQVFDDGRLTDGKGRSVSFTNTFIVLTSNLPVPNFSAHKELARKEMVRDALKPYMRAELINRIDEVVVFNKLRATDYERLVHSLLKDLNMKLADRMLRLELGTALVSKLVKLGLDSEFGGRAVKRAFETLVVDPTSDHILNLGERDRGVWLLEIDAEDNVFWEFEPSTTRYLPPAR
jgi:ATP-dependent Clp protease ATP-binding subunit ClpB